MNSIAPVLISLPTLIVEHSAADDGWHLAPSAALIAIILIVGFAVAAAGWAIGRDV